MPATEWQYMTMKLMAGGVLGGKVDIDEMSEALNEAGRAGWELVTAFDTNFSEGRSREVILVFKRPG